MRLVVKKYADGGWSAVETTNDGGSFVKQLAGRREVGQPISAYLEVTCDDNEKGADGVLAALSWLRDEVGEAQAHLRHCQCEEKKQEGRNDPTCKFRGVICSRIICVGPA